MFAALRTEYRKFVSTRMWWVLAIAMVVYLGFIAAFFSFALTADAGGSANPYGGLGLHGKQAAMVVYSLGNAIGYVFPLVIGSLAFTGEFRHKTITGSLLADPRRSVLLAAKLVASAVIGLFYGLLAAATVVGAGAPVLERFGDGAYLTDPDVVKLLGAMVLVFVIWTAMGVAFGALVGNQVAGIVIILAFTQFVEPIARTVGGAIDGVNAVVAYLPSAAADGVLQASFFSGFSPDTEILARTTGLLVMLGYVAVFAVFARLVTLRRDIA